MGKMMSVLRAMDAYEAQTTPAGQMEPDILDFGSVERELLDAGYEQRPPRFPDGVDDAKIVEHDTCADCGGPVVYVPFVRYKPWSYRAFAVCGTCNAGTEF